MELTVDSIARLRKSACAEILVAHGIPADDIRKMRVKEVREFTKRVLFVDESDVDREPDREPRLSVKLGFDVWTDTGRHREGEIVAMPVSIARPLLAEGKVSRADPLPGESD